MARTPDPSEAEFVAADGRGDVYGAQDLSEINLHHHRKNHQPRQGYIVYVLTVLKDIL